MSFRRRKGQELVVTDGVALGQRAPKVEKVPKRVCECGTVLRRKNPYDVCELCRKRGTS